MPTPSIITPPTIAHLTTVYRKTSATLDYGKYNTGRGGIIFSYSTCPGSILTQQPERARGLRGLRVMISGSIEASANMASRQKGANTDGPIRAMPCSDLHSSHCSTSFHLNDGCQNLWALPSLVLCLVFSCLLLSS